MKSELNYEYYGIPSGRELSARWDNTIKLGSIINKTIYDNYYTSGETPIADKTKLPLDTSVYQWHLPATATFACNSMYNIPASNTLNIDVATNKESNNVPLAVAAVVTQSGGYSVAGFYPSPHLRLAWDEDYNIVYAQSELAYDIPYIKYCVSCEVQMLNIDSSPTLAGVQVNDISTYIDDHPTAEITFLRCDIYAGNNGDRKLNNVTAPSSDATSSAGGYTQTYYKSLTYDVLSHKPVCDSATGIKSKLRDNHADWTDDKFYMPFAYRYRDNIGTNTSTTNMQYQHNIGINQSYTYAKVRTGATNQSGYGPLTAQCFRYNSDRHDFDDVSYHWSLVWFDDSSKVELENGYDITNMTGSGRIMTKLVIDDYKGQSRGVALERAVKHELAYVGFYFTDTTTGAESAILGSAGTGTGVYLPEIITGVTTGRYFTGDEIKDVPYADVESTDSFVYDPEAAEDSDSGDLQTILHSDSMSGSTKWYSFDELDVYLLSQWLNTTYKPSDVQLTEDFKGVNPADYIVSIKYYPFDVPSGNAEALTIGGIPVEVNNVAVSVNTHSREYGEGSNSYFDLGSFTMQPPYIFGDFRDTYIKLLLYIPWCGFVTLDPSVYCQSPDGTYHTIRAALSIDFATGSCIGMVYRDSTLIDTVNGTVGVDVPMTAVSNGSYQNAIKQTEIALKNAKAQQLTAYLSTAGALAGGIVSAATGNVAGVAASAAAFAGAATKTEQLSNTIEGLQYQLTHTAPAIGDISSASPFNAALNEQTAKLFIFRPVMLRGTDLQAYGMTTGFACCKAAQLSNFTGFTVCADVDLSGFEAPAHHKLLIKQALQKGVYL